MKLITDPGALQQQFLSLMDQYKQFFWASAWAGIGSEAFQKLQSCVGNISTIVVGIHFYQTHPDFIQTFLNNKKIRYRMQPDGTFHPKIYLFENSKEDWALLVGSGNFTDAAYTKNTEASVLITSIDEDANSNYEQAKIFIHREWQAGRYFTEPTLERYRNKWEIYRNKLQGASGTYGGNGKGKLPPHETDLLTWSWTQFIDEVYRREFIGVTERVAMLATVHEFLTSVKHFKDLDIEKRKFVAGTHSKRTFGDSGIFGQMSPNGLFRNRIIENDANISAALDKIPFIGDVTESEYNAFISTFQKAFSGTRLENANNLATATRLLTMKRPDTFICYDGENERGLCGDLHLKKGDIDFTSYWEDIIGRIRDCEWYQHPEPQNAEQEAIRDARSAFLDCLYYKQEPDD